MFGSICQSVMDGNTRWQSLPSKSNHWHLTKPRLRLMRTTVIGGPPDRSATVVPCDSCDAERRSTSARMERSTKHASSNFPRVIVAPSPNVTTDSKVRESTALPTGCSTESDIKPPFQRIQRIHQCPTPRGRPRSMGSPRKGYRSQHEEQLDSLRRRLEMRDETSGQGAAPPH